MPGWLSGTFHNSREEITYKPTQPCIRVMCGNCSLTERYSLKYYYLKWMGEMTMYSLDITDSYERFICMSSGVGLHHYITFPEISSWGNGDFFITLENIEINMYEDVWFSPILNNNPHSIIATLLKKVDVNEPDCILTVVLKRARVVMEKKSVFMRLENGGENYYHSDDCGFDIGDKYILLAGRSADYHDTMVWLRMVFTGRLFLEFDESDIIAQSIELDNNISIESAKSLNKSQELFIGLKKRSFSALHLNGIKSPFHDYSYLSSYFSCDENNNISIKNHVIDL
ncbi:hypothetical protein N7922_00225 [Kosakonia sp. ML.JS2a]|uniref:hypothetical protein n=1 Tax=Kosakonia sp. ML.JS2a TaxID=2980557 RepID=UPI0021DB2194|nr:hypothetical protein [Kosakonia sp. ML.JS2a]UXY10994.1 hypothetical protein N7922_00225 [Kosakonia sp. ML.JS2a]